MSNQFIEWAKQLQAQWAENARQYDRQAGEEDKALHYLLAEKVANTYHRCQAELGQLIKTLEESEAAKTKSSG